MAIEGELAMDDANVPVNLFLSNPHQSDSGRWELAYVWFMPRKETCSEQQLIVADTREEIIELVRKELIPFYQRPLALLKMLIEGRRDHFYYWDDDK